MASCYKGQSNIYVLSRQERKDLEMLQKFLLHHSTGPSADAVYAGTISSCFFVITVTLWYSKFPSLLADYCPMASLSSTSGMNSHRIVLSASNQITVFCTSSLFFNHLGFVCTPPHSKLILKWPIPSEKKLTHNHKH